MKRELSGKEEYTSSREYLLAVLTEYKLLQKKQDTLNHDLGVWRKREYLAAEKNEEYLRAAAAEKVSEFEDELKIINKEKFQLKQEADSLKRELTGLEPRKDLKEDTEMLLRQLEKLTGGNDDLEQKINNITVESELEHLKKEVKNSSSETS